MVLRVKMNEDDEDKTFVTEPSSNSTNSTFFTNNTSHTIDATSNDIPAFEILG